MADPVAFGELNSSRTLSFLSEKARSQVFERLEQVTVAANTVVVHEGDESRDLYFIISGLAQVSKGTTTMRAIGPGAEFGSLSLVTGKPRAATVTSRSALMLAKLSSAAFEALSTAAPAAALELVRGLIGHLRDDLVLVTESVGALEQGRSLPREEQVMVSVAGQAKPVRTGTVLRSLFPTAINGELVVGALLGQKPVSLSTPVVSACSVAPLTLNHWEGRQIYSRTVGLLLLEAAWSVDPGLDIRLGPSRGTAQLVEVRNFGNQKADLPALATRMLQAMRDLAAQGAVVRREQWTVDEAIALFQERRWINAARLLRSSRQSTVPLISCGQVYAMSLGPTLPDMRDVAGFSLRPHSEGHEALLVLDLGGRDPRRGGLDEPSALLPPEAGMVAAHRAWLAAMNVTSVGGFNELCVSGQVVQLMRVGEGFHEKQIGRIADTIAQARDRLRVIAIAGPSSSGKTTFIKRLTVQLQINGLNPIGLSLDDYYLDREKTARDEKGEYDFEALEALDLTLLQGHVRRLLEGDTVQLAHYDFKTGKSHPDGGASLSLKPGDLLMMEGIHGLNPGLLGPIPREGQVFKVFVHPATTLAFDRLNRVSATDLRLLRRIVRDRHSRGYSAAQNITRWPSVLEGERKHIFPWQSQADVVFDTALIYEPSVLKVYAERYLLEVPADHPSFATAYRLRHLIDRFVTIYPDHVPPTSIIREFIGGSGFEY